MHNHEGGGGSLDRRFVLAVIAVLAAGSTILGLVFRSRSASEAALQHQVQLARAEVEHTHQQAILPLESRLSRGESFALALQKSGLSAEDAAYASAAAQRAFNLRQLRAGNTIVVNRSAEGSLREIDYKIDADRMLQIVPADQGFPAEVQTIPSKMEIVTVSGEIDESLFNAMEQAGESPELTLRLAQIFSYDLDFYTDPRKGDTFHVVLERKNIRMARPRATERFSPQSTTTAGKNIRRYCFMTSLVILLTTLPTAKRCRRHSCIHRSNSPRRSPLISAKRDFIQS
jgi:hypothetical protein